MTDDLFRPEAVEHSTQRLYGHVVALPRASHLVASAFVCACVALLAAALLLGAHVEQRPIAGRLAVSRAAGRALVTAELRVPAPLLHLLEPHRRVVVRVAGLGPDAAGAIEAEVASAPDRVEVVAAGGDRSPGVFVVVPLTISASSLRSAGLPEQADFEVPIETTVVIATKSWMRWIGESLLTRPAQR